MASIAAKWRSSFVFGAVRGRFLQAEVGTLVYLDHAASTPLCPEAREAMLPWLSERWGNASSVHSVGRAARAAIDEARDRIAAALRVDYDEVLFTSGGTESNNLAILGILRAAPSVRRRLVVSAIEHPSVLGAARAARQLGIEVTYAPVDNEGMVLRDDLAALVGDDVALVSVMHANNEVGAIQDVPALARVAHAHGALFHTDAVQTFGLLPDFPRAMGCDLVTISSHKVYGPQGAGALYVRRYVAIEPCLHGGSQERERRPGTESVAALVGFGVAAAVADQRREEEARRLAGLRDDLIERLVRGRARAVLNGPRHKRLPNNVNVSMEGLDGATAVMLLDREGICASAGSACSSGSIEPSHVLMAMGLTGERAAGAVRLSLGRTTTTGQIEEVADAVERITQRVRAC